MILHAVCLWHNEGNKLHKHTSYINSKKNILPIYSVAYKRVVNKRFRNAIPEKFYGEYLQQHKLLIILYYFGWKTI